MRIVHLFPSTVFDTNIEIPESFVEYILSLCYEKTPSYDIHKNWASESFDVLSGYVKDVVLNLFHEFAKKELGYEGKFKISSSWATKIEPNGSTQNHVHSNVYYSGVLYLDICSPLILESPFQLWDINNKAHTTISNMKVCEFSPKRGDIIFFPSYLRHSVAKNKTKNDRYSVAFNIIPCVPYGSADSMIYQ